MEGSIAKLACLDVSIAAVVSSVTKNERRGGFFLKIFAVTFASFVTAALRQLEGRGGSFFKPENALYYM